MDVWDHAVSRSPDNNMQMSADNIAISLLRRFSEKQLPKASELEWLVSADDVTQEVRLTQYTVAAVTRYDMIC